MLFLSMMGLENEEKIYWSTFFPMDMFPHGPVLKKYAED